MGILYIYNPERKSFLTTTLFRPQGNYACCSHVEKYSGDWSQTHLTVFQASSICKTASLFFRCNLKLLDPMFATWTTFTFSYKK